MVYFLDRREAGRRLASLLEPYAAYSPIVLALPRGGVPVGFEVARALRAPLDLLIVLKVLAPGLPGRVLGAVAESGLLILDRTTQELTGASEATVGAALARELAELTRRVEHYRAFQPPPAVRDRLIILVDDGIATGGTVRAALHLLRAKGAARVVLATPVAEAVCLEALSHEADDVVCVTTTEILGSVGSWYDDFQEVDDDAVLALLTYARGELGTVCPERTPAPRRDTPLQGNPVRERAVRIPTGRVCLDGELALPDGPLGLVLVAHGDGGKQVYECRRAVAEVLQRRGLATLILDLLTPAEAAQTSGTGWERFDIERLSQRLVAATAWARLQPELAALPVGYFAPSTAAAAALRASALGPEWVGAVVSASGRPDLAAAFLAEVGAPTLLIVGRSDPLLLELNRAASRALPATSELAEIACADDLFEAAGTLTEVARLAAFWFLKHLGAFRGADGGRPEPR